MEYGIVPRVYDVDYSFIIKNYLDVDLWDKEWNIYDYKDITTSLSLNTIDCYYKSIQFKLKITCSEQGFSRYTTFYYYLRQSNFNILKKQINGAIFRLLEEFEQHMIVNSEGYQNLIEMYEDEEDNLRDITEAFLDDNNVTNDDIRYAYIESYINDNSKESEATNNYINCYKYLTLPDYFLTFTKSVGDEERYKSCYDKISSNLDIDKITNILNQAKIVCDFNEEYVEEMTEALEEI